MYGFSLHLLSHVDTSKPTTTAHLMICMESAVPRINLNIIPLPGSSQLIALTLLGCFFINVVEKLHFIVDDAFRGRLFHSDSLSNVDASCSEQN